MKVKAFILFSFLFISLSGYSQLSDTLVIDTLPKHSPAKATYLSLAVPGLGQAYNKKYWKIPIVYALIGTPLFFGIDQQRSFNEFKDAYVERTKGNATKYDGVYSDDNLLSLIDFHRQNRDLFFVLTGVAYALNVVDAAVDAHLFYFDVSDDLSARLVPKIQYSNTNRAMIPSLTLSLKFAKKDHRKEF